MCICIVCKAAHDNTHRHAKARPQYRVVARAHIPILCTNNNVFRHRQSLCASTVPASVCCECPPSVVHPHCVHPYRVHPHRVHPHCVHPHCVHPYCAPPWPSMQGAPSPHCSPWGSRLPATFRRPCAASPTDFWWQRRPSWPRGCWAGRAAGGPLR